MWSVTTILITAQWAIRNAITQMLEGLLAVTSHPSPLLSVDEFHDWYEKEHIPLTLNYLKDFLSRAWYKVCSLRPGQTVTLKDEQQTPQDDENSTSSWLALYAVTSSAVFSSSAYTDLRTNRSAPTERRT